MAAKMQAVDAVRACVEYAKVVEQEKTERAKIRAKRDVAVEAITAQKEVLLKYFELRFKERETALSKFFVQLDEGVKTRNDRLLDIALHGIVEIVKDNPLKDFAEFRKQMAKPDFMLEL
jgi:hypothetical protein